MVTCPSCTESKGELVMARTVRKRWTYNPDSFESFIDSEHRDVGCRRDCGVCGKPQARAERRRIRRNKRNVIREQME